MEKTPNGNVPLLADEYLISCNGSLFRAQLSQNAGLRVNGRQLSHDLRAGGGGFFSLLLDKRSFSLFVEQSTDEECLISVNGHVYRVTIEDRRSQIRKASLTRQGKLSAQETLRAPMPGLVVNVEVKEGTRVTAGQGLVVLEAMKMENEIKASSSGTVRAIHVSPGRVVEKGEPLISLEHN